MLTSPRRDHVSAVVVAFRSAPYLAACTQALLAAGVDDVVLVDNNDDDDSDAAAIRALCDASPGVVRHMKTGRNLGFGGACNAGAATATDADVLWFVNPDTVAAPGSARTLVEAMRAEGYALASPLLTTGPRGQETIWFGGGTFDLRAGRARHDLLGAPAAAAPTTPVECTFLTGAALAVTRDAWAALGGFAKEYFLYWEDSDLSWRATQAGLRLGLVPAAVVWHAEGASSAQDGDSGRSAVGYYYHARNRLLLARRTGHLLGWAAGAGLLATVKPVTAALLKERSGRKSVAALRGTLDGLAGRHTRRYHASTAPRPSAQRQ
ncbi:glycosyltransferase [Xylanimonas protaetiae]|uniref:glycosyltransferase n=1 Tax=Xylanimonas protaetiae TaxID=2509457 RepID=UPI0013EB72A2|nr:glycosyltransferase family 2 protein [Xylanimonas protaetiae]